MKNTAEATIPMYEKASHGTLFANPNLLKKGKYDLNNGRNTPAGWPLKA
jgi:hypothetical protein